MNGKHLVLSTDTFDEIVSLIKGTLEDRAFRYLEGFLSRTHNGAKKQHLGDIKCNKETLTISLPSEDGILTVDAKTSEAEFFFTDGLVVITTGIPAYHLFMVEDPKAHLRA